MNTQVIAQLVENYLRTIMGIPVGVHPTMQQVQQAAGTLLPTLPPFGFAGTMQDVCNAYTQNYMISVGLTLTMVQQSSVGWYQTWLLNHPKRGQFWNDYEFMQKSKLPLVAVQNMDDVTNKIMDHIGDPSNTVQKWEHLGLVVGNVQSGKTGNFIAVANKAIDAGYKIILVLSGTTTDLRRQTQMRVDQGIVGKVTDTQSPNAGTLMGVGERPKHPNVIYCTSSNVNGDFNSNATQVRGYIQSGTPIVMVCKKNPKILQNILKVFSGATNHTDPQDGLPLVTNLPILVIDDECDNASVNVNKSKASAINAGIRSILGLFAQSTYLAYTATPFANIFIDPATKPGTVVIGRNNSARTYRLTSDLFPKDFIFNLGAPKNYIGPNMLFDISSEANPQAPKYPIKIFEKITDLSAPIKKTNTITSIPDSLKEAIRCFIVSTAIRRVRGQKGMHSSMLINATQFVDQQYQIHALVFAYVQSCCNKLLHGDAQFYSQLEQEFYLRKLAQANRDVVNALNNKGLNSYASQLEWPTTWGEIAKELPIVAQKIWSTGGSAAQVRVINSTDDPNANTDKLDYENFENQNTAAPDNGNGLYVIVIGGNTMSRGLTLEGLTTTYFYRNSKTFDTLMQMGRWFGYRDGYLDLCRLYMTADMQSAFENIAIAMNEMRDDFEDMCDTGIKPSDYKLKVKYYPGWLFPTANNKFGNTATGELSLSRTTIQAYEISRISADIQNNRTAVINLLNSCHNYRNINGQGAQVSHHIFSAGEQDVQQFISSFKNPTNRCNPQMINLFIQKEVAAGHISNWTIAVINPQQGNRTNDVLQLSNGSSLQVGYTQRTSSQTSINSYKITNAALLGSTDETIDLGKNEYAAALNDTVNAWKNSTNPNKSGNAPSTPVGKYAKMHRPNSNALLLIYAVEMDNNGHCCYSFGISFPDTPVTNSTLVKYSYRGQQITFA